jgi:hypothetical protein
MSKRISKASKLAIFCSYVKFMEEVVELALEPKYARPVPL